VEWDRYGVGWGDRYILTLIHRLQTNSKLKPKYIHKLHYLQKPYIKIANKKNAHLYQLLNLQSLI
jgi:hypothetical protein